MILTWLNEEGLARAKQLLGYPPRTDNMILVQKTMNGEYDDYEPVLILSFELGGILVLDKTRVQGFTVEPSRFIPQASYDYVEFIHKDNFWDLMLIHVGNQVYQYVVITDSFRAAWVKRNFLNLINKIGYTF